MEACDNNQTGPLRKSAHAFNLSLTHPVKRSFLVFRIFLQTQISMIPLKVKLIRCSGELMSFVLIRPVAYCMCVTEMTNRRMSKLLDSHKIFFSSLVDQL